MSLNSLRDFGQAFASILKKMGCCAMSFQRGIVLVLFTNEEAAGLGLVAVHLIHQAAGFLAGFLRQFAEDVGHLGFTSLFRHPRHSQNNHLRSVTSFYTRARAWLLFSVAPPSCATNSSTKTVCSRPGPVETIPMRASLLRSTNDRYSRASFGSSSIRVIPNVEVRQPGIVW